MEKRKGSRRACQSERGLPVHIKVLLAMHHHDCLARGPGFAPLRGHDHTSLAASFLSGHLVLCRLLSTTLVSPVVPDLEQKSAGSLHTPNIAFRHLPPNSARFSYATLYLRAAVQRRGQHPPKGLGTDKTVEAA